MAMTPREEVEMWQRRDVVVDFVCALIGAFGIAFIVLSAL